MISVQKYQPCATLLQSVVEHYQWMETDEPLRVMTIPNGRVDAWVTIEGAFYFTETGLPAPAAGFFPLTGSNGYITIPQRLTIFTIKFLPHVLGFGALHQLPAAGSVVAFEHIFGNAAANEFLTLFKQVTGSEAAVAFAETFLEKHLFGHVQHNEWLAAALQRLEHDDSGSLTVQQLAAAVHVSVKTLERRFKKIIGVSPKIFMKLIRFQKAIRDLQKNGAAGNLAVSLGQGYFDQSHFIKDSRALTGLAPGKLLLRFAPHTSDVVLME